MAYKKEKNTGIIVAMIAVVVIVGSIIVYVSAEGKGKETRAPTAAAKSAASSSLNPSLNSISSSDAAGNSSLDSSSLDPSAASLGAGQ